MLEYFHDALASNGYYLNVNRKTYAVLLETENHKILAQQIFPLLS